MQKVSKYFLVFIITVLLFLPMTYFVGIKDKTVIIGSEYPHELPSIQTDSFFDKVFQKNFEEWWKSHFGFRNFMLKWKNTLYDIANFRQIHSGYSGIPIQTKDKYLLSKSTIDLLLNGKLEHNTEELKNILFILNNNLKINGITPLFVLGTSNAKLYEEKIPLRYTYFKNSSFDIFEYWENILSSVGIMYFNTQKFAEAIKETEMSIYSRTGFHWNQYGTMRVTQEVSKLLNLSPISIDDICFKKFVWPNDRDYSNLLNTYFDYLPDEEYPEVISSVEYPNNQYITIIGDSFSGYISHGLLLSKANHEEELFLARNRLISDEEAKKMLALSKKIIFLSEAKNLSNPDSAMLKNIRILNKNFPPCVMKNWYRNENDEYISTENSTIIIPNDYKKKLVTMKIAAKNNFELFLNDKPIDSAITNEELKIYLTEKDFCAESAVLTFKTSGETGDAAIKNIAILPIIPVNKNNKISFFNNDVTYKITGFRDAEQNWGRWSVEDELSLTVYFAEKDDYVLDFSIPYYLINAYQQGMKISCYAENALLNTWVISWQEVSPFVLSINKDMLDPITNSVKITFKIERIINPEAEENGNIENLGIFVHDVTVR